MRRTLLALVTASLATALACSSFDADSTPPPADAGVPDAPLPFDAGAVDAAAPPYCSTVDAGFCWSFDDETNPLLGPQLRFDDFNGFTPTLTDASASPPNALLTASPGDGGLQTSAVVVTMPATTHLHCEAAIFVVQQGPDVTNVMLYLTKILGPPNFTLRLGPNGTAESVRASIGIDFAFVDVGNVPVETWSRIGFDVANVSGVVTATGIIDGATKSTTLTADGGVPAFDGLDSFFGLTFANAGWQVRYDDVFCRSE